MCGWYLRNGFQRPEHSNVYTHTYTLTNTTHSAQRVPEKSKTKRNKKKINNFEEIRKEAERKTKNEKKERKRRYMKKQINDI